MIQLNDITFSFGGRVLMDSLSLHVKPQDRLGLVGANGSGKTTLLRIINEDIKEFEGRAHRRKGLTVGLLPQEGERDRGRTVFDAALEPFANLLALEKEIEHLNAAAAEQTGDEQKTTLNRYGELQHKYELNGGFTFRARAAEILSGLGFSAGEQQREIGTLSGGWQMRVALARLLLQRPDILLLDEPTNHLDLPALIWFENFLQTYPGAVMVVSHDRAFLDRVSRRIVELTGRKLEIYNGNYSFYEKEKEKRTEILLNRIANQEREIKHMEQFIERFRYKNTKARSVQSRIKMLDKIERLEAPEESQGLKFSFKAATRSGKVVIQLQDICKSYGDKKVLRSVNLTINRGDRVAVIGANGLGKTTLMRVIADRTDYTGERKPGHKVSIHYFAQDQYEMLSPDKTVLEEAGEAAGGNFAGNIRTLLGVFLFHGDDVEKKVEVLSGGEKSRLLLAKMMVGPANFLLLDEPTNHLDPPAREMLEQVLAEYDGTLCFVSHDRYFINSVANRIVEITPGGIEQYIGNYDDFVLIKKNREQAARNGSAASATTAQEPDRNREAKRDRAQLILDRGRALNPIRKNIEKTETRISNLETRIAEIEQTLADPETYNDPQKARSLPAELKEKKNELEDALSAWESLSEELAEKELEFPLED